jgi:hypothetical protein
VTYNVPLLLLSGDLDPVTPPTWAEQVRATLSQSRHIVVPGTGHGAIQTGCGLRIAREFIQKGSVDGLDTSCVDTLKRPPFFLTPAGPDPGGASKGAQP